MKEEILRAYEGHIVCFSHRIHYHDPGYTRFTRGIVHKGACYDIRIQMQGRPLFPEIYLDPIKISFIGKMYRLSEEQLSSLECAVLTALRSGKKTRVLMSILLHVRQA